MFDTFAVMRDFFQSSKLAGSYFMLYLVCIILMYYLNTEKHKWFVMYGIALMIFVVLNPLTVWILAKAFPALAIYKPLVMLIPAYLYITCTVADLYESIPKPGQRHVLMLAIVFLICICGNLCGFYQKHTINSANTIDEEEEDIVEYISIQNPQLVLADENIITAISNYDSIIPLLYGRDMYTYGMDTGIMDTYGETETSLYQAMQDTEIKADYIANTAYDMGCDIIVIKRYDSVKAYLGAYTVAKQTENYLIYELDD